MWRSFPVKHARSRLGTHIIIAHAQAHINELFILHNLDNNAGVNAGVLGEAQEQVGCRASPWCRAVNGGVWVVVAALCAALRKHVMLAFYLECDVCT